MAVMAAQFQTSEQEEVDIPERSLFDEFFSFLEEVTKCRQEVESKRKGPVHDYQGSEDDVSSEDSAGEDVPEHDLECMQDLQKEVVQLEISEEASTLETLILIVEHYIKTGDVEGFRKNMRRPDMWLMTPPRPKINDVIKMAVDLVKNNLPFRAVLMYKCACALYKYGYVRHPERGDVTSDDVTPDDAVRGIEACMWKATDVFNSLFTKDAKGIYIPHFVPVLYDMVTHLREIRHTDRKLKSELEVSGLVYISYIHGRVGEITEMADVADTAVNLIEKRFKSRARRLLSYSIGLFLISLAKYHSGDFRDAEEAAEKAVKALQDAEGFPEWEKKVEAVESANKLLEAIRKMPQ